MKESKNDFLVTLKGLRTSYGLNQQQASTLVDVSVWTWSNYEKGKTYPNSETIQKIEKVFNISYNNISFSPKLHLNSNYENRLSG